MSREQMGAAHVTLLIVRNPKIPSVSLGPVRECHFVD